MSRYFSHNIISRKLISHAWVTSVGVSESREGSCGLCVLTAALSNITFAKLLPCALKHVDEGERLLPRPRERWGHTWLVHDQWHSGGHIKVAVFGPLAVFS